MTPTRRVAVRMTATGGVHVADLFDDGYEVSQLAVVMGSMSAVVAYVVDDVASAASMRVT